MRLLAGPIYPFSPLKIKCPCFLEAFSACLHLGDDHLITFQPVGCKHIFGNFFPPVFPLFLISSVILLGMQLCWLGFQQPSQTIRQKLHMDNGFQAWLPVWIHLDGSVSFFHQPYLSSPNGLMNKVIILGEVEAIPGLSRWTSAYQDRSYLAMAPLSISSRDQHWVPNMVPFPGSSSSYLVMSCLYWPTPSWKGQCFVPPGIDSYSGYGFAFLAHNASIRGNIHGFTECLIVLYTALLLIRLLTLQQEWEWTLLMEFSGLNTFLWSFPGGLDGEESACNTADPGSISGFGRSPGEGND